MAYAASLQADLGCIRVSFGIVSNIFPSHIYAYVANATYKKSSGVCA
jgi:hypothetical protein